MSSRSDGNWIEGLFPFIIILGVIALILIGHLGAAFGILIIAAGILTARYIQRREPRGPGE